MISRRTFIQQNAVLAAALMIDPAELLKLRNVLGIQMYTVRDEEAKNFEKTLAQVAAAGYTHVELHGYEKRQFFGRSAQQIADLLKQNHLVSPSGHYGLSDMLYDADYKWDSWRKLMADAKTLGHKYVVIPWLEEKNRTMDDFKRVADRLNKAAIISKEEEIVTAYHNHNFEFKETDGVIPFEYLLSNTDKKNVKFEMDIYWVKYAGQDPIEWFNKHPQRFALWHIKDMEAPTDAAPLGQTCEVGNGIIDWKAIFEHQKEAGLEYAFVEQEQYRKPVFECIKTSADYMKANLLK